MNQIKKMTSKDQRHLISYKKINHLIRQGVQTLQDWTEQLDQIYLEALQINESPDTSLNLNAPWWVQILSTYPGFLTTTQRSSCEMLMALPHNPNQLPNWEQILTTASNLFKKRAKEANVDTCLRMMDPDDLKNPSRLCDGRAFRICPAFGSSNFFSWMKKNQHFDRRRVKRRLKKNMPKHWNTLYSEKGQNLWNAGLSSSYNKQTHFDDWTVTIECLAEAMIQHGARICTRCPGFFLNHPGALDDDEEMQRIDALNLDQLRTTWTLQNSVPKTASVKMKTL